MLPPSWAKKKSIFLTIAVRSSNPLRIDQRRHGQYRAVRTNLAKSLLRGDDLRLDGRRCHGNPRRQTGGPATILLGSSWGWCRFDIITHSLSTAPSAEMFHFPARKYKIGPDIRTGDTMALQWPSTCSEWFSRILPFWTRCEATNHSPQNLGYGTLAKLFLTAKICPDRFRWFFAILNTKNTQKVVFYGLVSFQPFFSLPKTQTHFLLFPARLIFDSPRQTDGVRFRKILPIPAASLTFFFSSAFLPLSIDLSWELWEREGLFWATCRFS